MDDPLADDALVGSVVGGESCCRTCCRNGLWEDAALGCSREGRKVRVETSLKP
jgi:hypothetical protein